MPYIITSVIKGAKMELFSVGEQVTFISENDIPGSMHGRRQLKESLEEFTEKHGNGPFPVLKAEPANNPKGACHAQEITVELPSGPTSFSGFWFKKHKP